MWRGKLDEDERKLEREIPREKGQRARGRSSGSSEARVTGEGRGFESGVAFRGARSALSSREPGERERTCVPARRKRVVFSNPRQTSTLVAPVAHSRQKRNSRRNRDKRRLCQYLPLFFFLLPSPRFSHLFKIWTRHSGMRRQLINASGYKTKWKIKG